MNNSQKAYEELHGMSRNAQVLSGISHILEWDQETLMPPDGGPIRGEQLKMMAGIIHKERTSKKYGNAIGKLIDLKSGKILSKGLDPRQKSAVQVWRKDYLKDIALPSSFVEEFTKLSSQAQLVWRKAKNEDKFAQFAPFLDKIISMTRKRADLLGYKDHPYDALLDLYEPNMTTKEVEQLFSKLKKSITTLVKKTIDKRKVTDTFLFGEFDHAKQIEFGKTILEAMGFTSNKGRLDFSTHPFSSSSHPSDNRITTRIHPTSLMSNISVCLHEGGHALYEMGLPEIEYGSPLGQAISLGVHESQSRWWETYIGQSASFWKYYFPKLKKHFNSKLGKVTLEQFYSALNKVEPSFIRVEADEVTYPLHVILRFELEKGLIEGTLSVRDIPEAWNAKMKELLGITPKNNVEGCLQDVHWSFGAFGYFPTYTLGNMYAGQLFKTFEKEHSNWKKRVEGGELLFIKDWLQNKVHQYGRQFTSKELIKKVTGKEFTADDYVDYLNKKYSAIYK